MMDDYFKEIGIVKKILNSNEYEVKTTRGKLLRRHSQMLRFFEKEEVYIGKVNGSLFHIKSI